MGTDGVVCFLVFSLEGDWEPKLRRELTAEEEEKTTEEEEEPRREEGAERGGDALLGLFDGDILVAACDARGSRTSRSFRFPPASCRTT